MTKFIFSKNPELLTALSEEDVEALTLQLPTCEIEREDQYTLLELCMKAEMFKREGLLVNLIYKAALNTQLQNIIVFQKQWMSSLFLPIKCPL